MSKILCIRFQFSLNLLKNLSMELWLKFSLWKSMCEFIFINRCEAIYTVAFCFLLFFQEFFFSQKMSKLLNWVIHKISSSFVIHIHIYRRLYMIYSDNLTPDTGNLYLNQYSQELLIIWVFPNGQMLALLIFYITCLKLHWFLLLLQLLLPLTMYFSF